MKDDLGDKFKAAEKRLRSYIPDRGGYLILRIDGKAFHTFTRGMQRPFDRQLCDVMDSTVFALCHDSDIPVKFAYTQSDEISLVLSNTGEPWFGGQIQKIVSVTASLTAAYFAKESNYEKIAAFDARVMQVFEHKDVLDYLIWRKADANRNAISMQAQSMFSHKELQGKHKGELLGMIGGADPDALPISDRFYNGAYFYSEVVPMPLEYIDKRTGTVESTVANRRVWYMSHDNHMIDLLTRRVIEL